MRNLFLALCIVVIVGCGKQSAYDSYDVQSPFTDMEILQHSEAIQMVTGFVMVQVQGDSMYPLIQDGQRVFIANVWERVDKDQIIVFNSDHGFPMIHWVMRKQGDIVHTRALNSKGRGWDREDVTKDKYIGTLIW